MSKESDRVHNWEKENTKIIKLRYMNDKKITLDEKAKELGYKHTASYLKDIIYKETGIK